MAYIKSRDKKKHPNPDRKVSWPARNERPNGVFTGSDLQKGYFRLAIPVLLPRKICPFAL